ncbi:uncharacterized protein LOC143416545 isoform X2 [Maylandia zebra]|uniref:uncharacterized protein LOC143416545 isoform X2 n=1 Tax=Maylandia zebra TaxID=106582 RepID=UPI00403C9F2B
MAAVTVCSTSKGLFLVFTLLSLVCFSSSLIDKDQLTQFKENYQNMKQHLDKLKAQREEEVNFNSELLSEYLKLMDPFIEVMKRSTKDSPDGFYEEVTLMESYKNLVAVIKVEIDRKNKNLGEKMEETEKELGELNKRIKCIEEHRDEL